MKSIARTLSAKLGEAIEWLQKRWEAVGPNLKMKRSPSRGLGRRNQSGALRPETAGSRCPHWDEWMWTISFLSPPIMLSRSKSQERAPIWLNLGLHSLLPVLGQEDVFGSSNFHKGSGAWYTIPLRAKNRGLWHKVFTILSNFALNCYRKNEAILLRDGGSKEGFLRWEELLFLYLVDNGPVDSQCGWKVAHCHSNTVSESFWLV